MKVLNRLLAIAVAAIAFGAVATPASAQATRTWVSGVGDDVNPCSRTAPCKTFAGAISKTAAGGEINCLDPGGYGTLTITKSITVDCTGTIGSALNSGGINGFVINDSATATPGTINVILRGLSIDGAGATKGLNGIRFVSGRSLYVEDVLIQNQSNAGVSVAPTASASVRIVNSQIVNTSLASTGGGIFVQPSGTAAVRVDVENTQLVGNTNAAIRVDSTNNTGTGILTTISKSEMSGSAFGIIANQHVGKSPISIMVSASTVSNSTSSGIFAAGANARVRIGGSSITNNGTAASVAVSGVVNSYGNNQINGNTTSDGTFVAIPLT